MSSVANDVKAVVSFSIHIKGIINVDKSKEDKRINFVDVNKRVVDDAIDVFSVIIVIDLVIYVLIVNVPDEAVEIFGVPIDASKRDQNLRVHPLS